MAHMLVRHKVKDYAKWKSDFDAFSATRKANGEKSYQLFRMDDDPDNTVLLFEWDSLDNARKFLSSEELKDAMQGAGVCEEPEVYYLEEVEE
ncbi:MAG: cyclase [Planctomycetes bacterium]|nr:cyclase [Planctomycetota bacterium]